MSEPRYFCVIPAAGVGARMQANKPKQYLPLNGRMILEHTLDVFLSRSDIQNIIVPVQENDTQWQRLNAFKDSRVLTTSGGATRAQSVLSALKLLESKAEHDDWVMVHDAVRPFLQQEEIDRLQDELKGHPVGGILALPVRDTLKHVNVENGVAETVDRSDLWQAQTPQMFRYGVLKSALQKADERGQAVTDEASAIESEGLIPKVVRGSARNIKITFPEDLLLCE